jgi:sec-independent protein translocase protein TatA
MLNNIGATELIIILVVLMILFGTKKIPEFARGLGEAGQEFKKGLRGEEETKKTKVKTEKTQE